MDCENCVKLEKQVRKLEGSVDKREDQLEKALDDLATAEGARDEAVKKANRIAEAATAAEADGSGQGGSGGGDSGAADSGDAKPSLWNQIMNWPFT